MNPDVPHPGPTPPPVAPRPRGAFELARIGGVPVYLHSSYLLLAAVVILGYGPLVRRTLHPLSAAGGYLVAAAFVVFLLVSVLLHELGHALVARRYGIGVKAITLELLGGYTELTGESPNPRADALVSLVGPAVSAAIGGVGLALQWLLPAGVADQLAFQLAWSNLIVAGYNILPGLPLDGGRALRALVWKIGGNRHRATTVAGWAGQVIALATLGLSAALFATGRVGPSLLVVGAVVAVVMWQGATASIRQARIAARLPTVDLRRLARPVVAVPTGTPLAEAVRRLEAMGRPDAALGVTDSLGRLVAVVEEPRLADVPLERRPWVPVDSVARTLDSGQALPVHLTGEDVVAAVQAHPAPNYLVVSGQQVIGLLRTADLYRMLSS
jgi:Zn-dependent protease